MLSNAANAIRHKPPDPFMQPTPEQMQDAIKQWQDLEIRDTIKMK